MAIATSEPSTATPPRAKDNAERIGKTITSAAAIIGLVVTANTFVVSCSKDSIDRTAGFRNAVKSEQQFWSGLFGQYLAAVNDGDTVMNQRRSKLMAIAMLATHENPDFDEFTAWYESDKRAQSATEHLDRMRQVLQEALRDQRSSNPEIAHEIGFFLDGRNAVRDRTEEGGAQANTPPEVTEQAQTATEVRAQNQSAIPIAPADSASIQPFYDSRILAAGASTGWDVDIFWCVGGADEQQTFARALGVGEALAGAAQSGSKIGNLVTLGRVRLRSLPASQQGGGLYYTRGDSIVADGGPGENEAAQAVRGFIRQQTQTQLRSVRSVGLLTSWYLSIFVCPAAPAAPSRPAGAGVPVASRQ
jgi:hypothetical protein